MFKIGVLNMQMCKTPMPDNKYCAIATSSWWHNISCAITINIAYKETTHIVIQHCSDNHGGAQDYGTINLVIFR